MNNSGWTLKSRLRSFKYAIHGIGLLFRQPNACIHAFVTLIVLLCGWWFEISAAEWCIVMICIGMVLAAEAFNSAIETLADRVCEGYDAYIGRCKDIAAGAVLLAVIAVVIAGLIIFLPKFILKFRVLFC
ncbi:MAG: diacylglycerol kinase family protein [Muribaculaceae bacterium]|nr:diacylglycerol kinase family protein [Muribaculaceae bacterium]MDE6294773.1 diacylglycerol kinase family protein [Muribaculaceae bacterium]